MNPVSRLLVLAAIVAAPASVEAQSIFSSAGLGRPLEAVDGRARALGSVGIGLQGGSISPGDPAAADAPAAAGRYCRRCGYETDWNELRELIFSSGYPNCPECGSRKGLRLVASEEELQRLRERHDIVEE